MWVYSICISTLFVECHSIYCDPEISLTQHGYSSASFLQAATAPPRSPRAIAPAGSDDCRMNQHSPSYPSTPSLPFSNNHLRRNSFLPARSNSSTPIIPFRTPYGSLASEPALDDSTGYGSQSQAYGSHRAGYYSAMSTSSDVVDTMSPEEVCTQLYEIEQQILALRRVYIECVTRIVAYVKSLASSRFFAVDQEKNCSDSALFSVRASNLYTLIHAVESPPQLATATSSDDAVSHGQNVSTDALAVRFYPLLVERDDDAVTSGGVTATRRLSFSLVPQDGFILALPNASPHSPPHDTAGTSARTASMSHMCVSMLCVHMRTMVQRMGATHHVAPAFTREGDPGSQTIKLLHRTPKQLVSAQVVMDERVLSRQTLHSITQLAKSNTSGVGVELACIGSFTRGGRQRPLAVLQRIRFSVEHLVTRDDPPIWPLSVAQSLFDDEHELCVTLRDTLVAYDRIAHKKRALVILQASFPTGGLGYVNDGVGDAAPVGSASDHHGAPGATSPIFAGSSVSLHPNAASISAGAVDGVGHDGLAQGGKIPLAIQQALLHRGNGPDDQGPEMSCAVM